MLALSVGVREAARQMGLSEEAVMKWSQRENWFRQPEKAVALPPTMQPVIVRTVRTAPEALAESLEDLSKRSRIGFAKASVKVAESLARKEPDELLEQAQSAQAWAKTAATAGNWAAELPGTTTIVNVALMNGDLADNS